MMENKKTIRHPGIELPESRSDENLFVLNFATRLLLGINHRDELLKVAIETFADFGQSERLTFYALSEQNQTAQPEAVWHHQFKPLPPETISAQQEPGINVLFDKTVQLLMGRVENDVLRPDAEHGTVTLLAFPIIAEGGKNIGNMLLQMDKQPTFEQFQHLRVLASLFAIAIENLRLIHFTTRSTEARYRAIVENSPDLICRFIENGTITFVNETFCRFFDRNESDILHTPFSLETHEEDRASFHDCWTSLSPTMAAREIQCRVRPQPDKERYMHWTFRPVLDDDGTFIEYQTIGRDITLQKRAAEEQRAIKDKMVEAQKLESLGILAGGVAHDFNNLLATVLGNTDLAIESPGVPEEVRGYLGEAKAHILMASKLSQQMLIYAGHQIVRPKPLSLNDAILALRQLWQSNLPPNVNLSFALTPHLPDIHADTPQLHQVLMNIISNAQESFGDDGGSIHVSTGLADLTKPDLRPMKCNPDTPAGPYLYVRVEDTGCGIPADSLSQIFEPFFSSKFIGRGLGLAAAYGIMLAHNGAIDVKSAPGKGSRFTVYFPVPKPGAKPALRSGPKTKASPTGRRILVVEDEPAVRKVLEYVLKRTHYDVQLAIDGQDALDQFWESPDAFAAVLMDMKMPRLSGEKAFAEIKKIRADVPVIILTGYAEESVMESFQNGEPAAFLQKPFEVQHLVDTLQHVLE